MAGYNVDFYIYKADSSTGGSKSGEFEILTILILIQCHLTRSSPTPQNIWGHSSGTSSKREEHKPRHCLHVGEYV